MKLRNIVFIFCTLFLVKNVLGQETITIGQPAPEFVLEDLSGKKVGLTEFKSQLVLLIFFTTWCPYCRKEIPELTKLYNENKNAGLVILGVDIKEPNDKVNKFVTREKIEFPILLDTEGKVAAIYQVPGIPMNVLIDRTGIIRFREHFMPNDKLIKSLLIKDKPAKKGKKIR